MTSSPVSSRSEAPQYLFAISIYQDLHEALGLAFLIRAADVFHCHCRNQRGLAGLADLRFRHAGAAERRIRVKRISGDPVAHAPLIVIEKVGRPISKSFHDVCVNAPRPLQSPIAQIPGTLVCS